MTEISFTVGVEQRPVKMDKTGKLTLGKPKEPRRGACGDGGDGVG